LSATPTPNPTPPDDPDETPAADRDEPDEPDEPAKPLPTRDPGPRPEWGLLGFVVHKLLTDSAALRRALALVFVVVIVPLVAFLVFLVALARTGNLATSGAIYAIVFGSMGRLLWQWRRRGRPPFPGRARLNRMFPDGPDR
jgi:hypothetical protein